MIGVQARSSSVRLPSKVLKKVDGRPMIDKVLEACRASAHHINFNKYGDIRVNVAVLVPDGDPLERYFEAEGYNNITVVTGSLDDVLSRYMRAVNEFLPDYICRITADCPMIPHFVISKHIVTAVKQRLDYVSNVDPRFRTEPDGYDCEVLSRRLFDYTNESAKDPSDREHVTTYVRKHMPVWAKWGQFCGYADRSELKYSVDTQEDFERVANNFTSVKDKIQAAQAAGIKVFRL